MIKITLSDLQLNELKDSRKDNSKFQYIRRIECILYRFEWKDNPYIIKKLDISHDSITLRVKTYKNLWIAWLLDIKFSERNKSKIANNIDEIREHVKNNKIPKLKILWEYIKDQFWIDYCISSLSKLCKKNEIFLWKNHVAFHEK